MVVLLPMAQQDPLGSFNMPPGKDRSETNSGFGGGTQISACGSALGGLLEASPLAGGCCDLVGGLSSPSGWCGDRGEPRPSPRCPAWLRHGFTDTFKLRSRGCPRKGEEWGYPLWEGVGTDIWGKGRSGESGLACKCQGLFLRGHSRQQVLGQPPSGVQGKLWLNVTGHVGKGPEPGRVSPVLGRGRRWGGGGGGPGLCRSHFWSCLYQNRKPQPQGVLGRFSFLREMA